MELSISQLMQLQQELYELHRGQWSPREPETGKEHILYMIEEIGETIAILKKKGPEAIMADPQVRSSLLEEMADVLMFYIDILLCFHVSPEEFSRAYMEKHLRNMGRNYAEEYAEKYR